MIFSRDKFKIYYLLLLVVVSLPLLLTLPLDVIDIDSAQYAEIAREMVESGNYFRLVDNGRRYLDKPILTTWSIASSFAVFGIENFAYRLPALFLTFLSFYSLYRIAILVWQDQRVAFLSVFFYATSPGLYAMVVDPKIDIYLCAYLVFTFHAYFLGRKISPNYYYLMYFFMSLGFVTKGPVSIVIPGLAIGGDILYRRDWKILMEMKLFPGILIASIFPLVWCYLLFLEFNSYGPVYFLWIQSFGRFYKEMYNIKFDPFYFYKSFIWAFGNGSFFLFLFSIGAIWNFIKKFGYSAFAKLPFRGNDLKSDVVLGFWVFLFLFLISFSRYPLPQYVYWILPGASLLFARTWVTKESQKSLLLWIPAVLGVLLFALPFGIRPIVQAGSLFYLALYGIAFLLLAIGFTRLAQPLALAVLGFAFFYFTTSLVYYPLLLEYQPSKEIGKYIQEREPEEKEILTFKISRSKRTFAFYSQRKMKTIFEQKKLDLAMEGRQSRLVLLPQADWKEWESVMGENYQAKVLLVRKAYKVATPKRDFIEANTRAQTLQTLVLCQITRK